MVRREADLDPILKKPDWIPLYLNKLKGSSAYGKPDFVFGQYMHLLIELADSDRPAYLPSDPSMLMKYAGARVRSRDGVPTQAEIRVWHESVWKPYLAAHFKSTEDGKWIYNARMLEILQTQGKKLSTKARSSPQQVEGAPSSLFSLVEFDELKKTVRRVFDYYCQQLHRNPAKYTLTPERAKMAENRLIFRMDAAKLTLAQVEQEARIAIENLAASQWHRDNGQISWELIFRNNNDFEERLNAVPRKQNHVEPLSYAAKRERRIIDNTIEAFDTLAGGVGGAPVGIRRDDAGGNRPVGPGVVEVPRGRGD